MLLTEAVQRVARDVDEAYDAGLRSALEEFNLVAPAGSGVEAATTALDLGSTTATEEVFKDGDVAAVAATGGGGVAPSSSVPARPVASFLPGAGASASAASSRMLSSPNRRAPSSAAPRGAVRSDQARAERAARRHRHGQVRPVQSAAGPGGVVSCHRRTSRKFEPEDRGACKRQWWMDFPLTRLL